MDRRLWLVDPAGAGIAISISSGLLDAHGAAHPAAVYVAGLKVGDVVTCCGSLAQTKGRARTWQLAPAAPDDFAAADESTWRNDNANR